MGIPGLLPFLSNSTRDAHISEFENEFVAIDAYCWLHKGIYSCAFELATKKPTIKYVNYCLRYIEMLLHFKVKPILVFDGRQLSSKKETEKKRREERKKKFEKGKELMRAGKHFEGRKLLGESVDVTHEMALNFMKQCRAKNIDCLVAPYEADAQLAFLSLRNIVKCVITEDSDLLVYGSERVMFKMDASGRGKLIEKNEIHFSLNMTPEEFNEDLFRYLCILIGCDYLPSLHSIGPVNALKFIKMLKDKDIYEALPKLPSYINKKNLEVPPEYVNGFRIADKTFNHQLVYDPLRRSQVPLKPVKNEDDIVGTKLADDVAFNLAVGNIDPMTMRVLDNYDPDKTGKGFTLLWKTDFLSNAAPRQSLSLPEAKKRQREVLESNNVQSITNDLKKQRTPFNVISIKNSITKTSTRKIPDSGFDFEPKISVETSNTADESKLLKSRYFSPVRSKSREKKEIEGESDRRKDESYDDYLQRLYNEYFPQGENENEEPERKENCATLVEKCCSLCQNELTCCTCAKETANVSDRRKLGDEVLRENKIQHFLLDEINKAESEKTKELSDISIEEKQEEEKKVEKVSPSQVLTFDFSKILSKLTDTPSSDTEIDNFKSDVIEKENSEITIIEEEDTVRSPSPVFKIQRDTKVSKKNCRIGNTAGTPTSVYFSSESKNYQGSRRTSLNSQKKTSSVKNFGSMPSKTGKSTSKGSTVNRTLFQFGFKKQSRENC